MKLLVTSDWHADAKTIGHARFGDVERAVGEMVQRAIELRVGAFLFLGDLCDPDSGSAAFRSVELAVSAAMTLSRAGIRSIWMAGNHDVIEDGSGDTTLSPLRPLDCMGSLVEVVERPRCLELGVGLRLQLLPYTATSHPYDPKAEVDGLDWRGCKLVVAGHLAVEGVEPGEETTDMPRGRDVVFPRECFSLADKVVLLNGHYHRQQTHERPGFVPLSIPGSPARFTFGEQDNRPGYLIVEV